HLVADRHAHDLRHRLLPDLLALAVLRPDMERLDATDLVVDRAGDRQRQVNGTAGRQPGRRRLGIEGPVRLRHRVGRTRGRTRPRAGHPTATAGEDQGEQEHRETLHAYYDGGWAKKFRQAASQDVGASSISLSIENGPGSIASAVSSTTVTSAGVATDCTIVRSRAAPRKPRSPQAMNLRSSRGPRSAP